MLEMTLQDKARLISTHIFTGGPVDQFEIIGRLQFALLIREGLNPDSKTLDVGCGALRGGFWLIHFLRQGHYHGIEPNKAMVDTALEYLFDPIFIQEKQPQIDYNSDFDFSVFGKKLDFFLARSIWTHASKLQIKIMLDGFKDNSTDGAVFLTSYLRVSWPFHRDYKGNEWVGKSHESDAPGLVRHKLSWIQAQCASRQLKVRELDYGIINRQKWLIISKVS
jgi:hypothetical protein